MEYREEERRNKVVRGECDTNGPLIDDVAV